MWWQLISTFWMKIKSKYFILLMCLAAAIYLVFNIQFTFCPNTSNYLLSNIELQQYREKINIIDLDTPIEEILSCIKTKAILDTVRTTICPHNASDFVSRHYQTGSIYEEELLSIFLRLLINNPEYGFIDIGGNIGTYTMFVAAFNRSVITIECFRPNYLRIAKAIQTENLQNRVILIGNAIYSKSGQYLRLSADPNNIGGQGIYTNPVKNNMTDPYVVKTIRFDDVLPLIKETKMRSFFMKIDIEGSEFHVFNTSAQAFDYLTISVIMMEWTFATHSKDRGTFIINFLTARGYIPTKNTCSKLNIETAFKNWPPNVFWIKKSEIGKILFG